MASREDPLVSFHFAVEIQGVVKGYFTECSGLGSEHEIIEHKVVNEKGKEIVLNIPGRMKWEKIVLKRGITSSMDIWDWRKKVEDGDVDANRHDGMITMFDQNLKPVACWEFYRAWPVKVTGPSVKADSNEIGVEELTLAHEYIVRKK
ncbi:MAG: phage tail protein [Chloroflexi bacterium]|nr:MAG: phage tail protein [Chloroflexota bacterium]